MSIRSFLWKFVLVITIVSFLGFSWQDILDIIQPLGVAFAHGVAGLIELLRAFFGTIPELLGSSGDAFVPEPTPEPEQ